MREILKYFFLIIIICGACNQHKESTENKTTPLNAKQNSQYDLIGVWSINEIIQINKGKEVSSVYNICPQINFDFNNIAVVTFPGNGSDSLNWYASNDTLTLKNINAKTKLPYFFNTRYKISFTKEKGYRELKLNRGDDYIYVLRK